jgi:hypothetical protein
MAPVLFNWVRKLSKDFFRRNIWNTFFECDVEQVFSREVVFEPSEPSAFTQHVLSGNSCEQDMKQLLKNGNHSYLQQKRC